MPASFQDRYDTAKESYIKTNDKQFADLPAGTTVLIPSPQDIESVVNALPEGNTLNLTELRGALAEMHDADGTCPVMCGMNLRVAAEVTLEAIDAGVPQGEVVPIWNVIEPKSNLAKKLPGGVERIRRLRGERT